MCTLSKNVGVSIPTGAYLKHISNSPHPTTFKLPPLPVELNVVTKSSIFGVCIVGNITALFSPSVKVLALANVLLLLSPTSFTYTFPKNKSNSIFSFPTTLSPTQGVISIFIFSGLPLSSLV